MATPLGTNKPSSAAMAGEKGDASKVDPKNVIGTEYGDVPKDQRNTLETYPAAQRRHQAKDGLMLWEDSARYGREREICHTNVSVIKSVCKCSRGKVG